MTSWHREHLADTQFALLDTWLPDAQLGADLSWDLALTTVLDVSAGAGRFIVKAGSGDNHHVSREIAAHRTATGVLAGTGHASRMVHCDNEANILVTTYLPGQLVQGTSAEADPDTYLQAGRLLGRFHRQHVRIDDAVDARATCKALAWLDGEHRIDHGTATLLRKHSAPIFRFRCPLCRRTAIGSHATGSSTQATRTGLEPCASSTSDDSNTARQ